ncbi:MAG: tRNA (adenosine(37)-N6)-threonylcarbamoyltransferase complex dimerization subunit type 1 TsaB [Elusimicrobia bacterium]|nr:tRNA (adenosine(37)-N6)-threonylcarbamoyltransferase complex dimerization subunit type 1 TsaB [Elusimicrobiota bacterium]
MNILAADATGEVLSLALETKGRVLAAWRSGARTHDMTLLPAAEGLLKRAGLRWEDLDAVAAAAGPGRFTGIRVGLAFAAAAGFQLKIPVLALSRLEAAALKSRADRVLAALPGWKDEVYYQEFRRTRRGLEPRGEAAWAAPKDWPAARAAAEIAGLAVVFGDTDAADLLPAARRRLQSKRLPPLRPFYLKPAGYERPH